MGSGETRKRAVILLVLAVLCVPPAPAARLRAGEIFIRASQLGYLPGDPKTAVVYQVWKSSPADRDFARRCLRAGREVYALGKRHEGVQQGNSFSSPYRYNEATWADDMEWG